MQGKLSTLQLLKSLHFNESVYIVGGALRDNILGLESKDIDLLCLSSGSITNVTKQLKQLFKDKISSPFTVGAHPITKMRFKEDVEFKGSFYHCKNVELDIGQAKGSLIEDIRRRDFTINMLAFDLVGKELLDLSGLALKNIQNKTLNTFPDVSSESVFIEDPIRILRLFRFSCIYDFSIAPKVEKVLTSCSRLLKEVSPERIRTELEKVCIVGKLSQFIDLADRYSTLKYFLPEVSSLKGVEQDVYYHSEGDVFTHTLMVVKNSPKGVIPQLAALFHDVGKPQTQEFFPNEGGASPRIRFLRHELIGAELSENILKRLRFDNRTTIKVRTLVKNHLRPLSAEKWSLKAVRKFCRDLGEETNACLDLAEADILSSFNKDGQLRNNPIPKIRKEINKQQSTIKLSPILSGKEIIEALVLNEGPRIGEIKKKLLEWEDEQISLGKTPTKQSALTFIKDYLSKLRP